MTMVLVPELEGAPKRTNAIVIRLLGSPSLLARDLHQLPVSNALELFVIQARAPISVQNFPIAVKGRKGHVVARDTNFTVPKEGVEHLLTGSIGLTLQRREFRR